MEEEAAVAIMSAPAGEEVCDESQEVVEVSITTDDGSISSTSSAGSENLESSSEDDEEEEKASSLTSSTNRDLLVQIACSLLEGGASDSSESSSDDDDEEDEFNVRRISEAIDEAARRYGSVVLADLEAFQSNQRRLKLADRERKKQLWMRYHLLRQLGDGVDIEEYFASLDLEQQKSLVEKPRSLMAGDFPSVETSLDTSKVETMDEGESAKRQVFSKSLLTGGFKGQVDTKSLMSGEFPECSEPSSPETSPDSTERDGEDEVAECRFQTDYHSGDLSRMKGASEKESRDPLCFATFDPMAPKVDRNKTDSSAVSGSIDNHEDGGSRSLKQEGDNKDVAVVEPDATEKEAVDHAPSQQTPAGNVKSDDEQQESMNMSEKTPALTLELSRKLTEDADDAAEAHVLIATTLTDVDDGINLILADQRVSSLDSAPKSTPHVDAEVEAICDKDGAEDLLPLLDGAVTAERREKCPQAAQVDADDISSIAEDDDSNSLSSKESPDDGDAAVEYSEVAEKPSAASTDKGMPSSSSAVLDDDDDLPSDASDGSFLQLSFKKDEAGAAVCAPVVMTQTLEGEKDTSIITPPKDVTTRTDPCLATIQDVEAGVRTTGLNSDANDPDLLDVPLGGGDDSNSVDKQMHNAAAFFPSDEKIEPFASKEDVFSSEIVGPAMKQSSFRPLPLVAEEDPPSIEMEVGPSANNDEESPAMGSTEQPLFCSAVERVEDLTANGKASTPERASDVHVKLSVRWTPKSSDEEDIGGEDAGAPESEQKTMTDNAKVDSLAPPVLDSGDEPIETTKAEDTSEVIIQPSTDTIADKSVDDPIVETKDISAVEPPAEASNAKVDVPIKTTARTVLEPNITDERLGPILEVPSQDIAEKSAPVHVLCSWRFHCGMWSDIMDYDETEEKPLLEDKTASDSNGKQSTLEPNTDNHNTLTSESTPKALDRALLDEDPKSSAVSFHETPQPSDEEMGDTKARVTKQYSQQLFQSPPKSDVVILPSLASTDSEVSSSSEDEEEDNKFMALGDAKGVRVDYESNKYRGFVAVLHEQHGVLVLHSSGIKREDASQHWQLPGGQIHECEFIEAARYTNDRRTQLELASKACAARELFDQTGLDFRFKLGRLVPASLPHQPSKGSKKAINELKHRYFFVLRLMDNEFLSEGDYPTGSLNNNLKIKLSAKHSEFTFQKEPSEASNMVKLQSAGKCSEALPMVMDLPKEETRVTDAIELADPDDCSAMDEISDFLAKACFCI